MALALTSNLRGIGLMTGSATVFAMKDGFAKHLAGIYPVAELVWAQYTLLLVMVLPFILWRYGRPGLMAKRPWSQMLRGALGVAMVALFYLAIQDIPLADATALAFISPVVVTLLSPWILKEKVGLRRWAAVIIGFGGILLIVQPGFQEIRIGTVYGLASGVVFALFQIATRKLAQQETPMVTVLYTALVGAVALNIFAPLYWVTPEPVHGAMFFVVGLFAAVGQATMIYAFVAAPAVVVAPFFYVTIIVATATGYLAFGDFPGPLAWAGIAIIVGCGIYIAVREARVKEVTA